MSEELKEIDLSDFIFKNKQEYNKSNDETEIYLFIDTHLIDDFYQLIKSDNSILDDEGWECTMREGYFVFEMIGFCNHYGFDYKKIFKA